MSAEPGTAARAGPLQRLGLRARIVGVSTVLLAVALVAAGLLARTLFERSLLADLDDAARARGADVARLVDAGELTDPIPVAGGAGGIQVLDADGRVQAASPGGDALAPLLEPGDLAEVRAGGAALLPGARIGVDDPLRVVGVDAGTREDPVTVLVASSLAETRSSLRAVDLALIVGGPLLLLGLAALSWLVVGSALRPVASLRAGAEEITGAGVEGRRLPVPAAEDELRRLAVTLNRMLDRLEGASERQRVFVADAAHELRSPLTSVRTQLEVALRHGGAADWQETATGVLAEAERMSRLVDDLLVLARLDEGTLVGPRPRPVALEAVVADTVGRRGATRVPLDVTAADGPLFVSGDVDALGRVVGNLVDNATRYASSAVSVDLARADGRAVLTVVDDGPGIPAQDRERVFERFAQVDASRAGTGTGLGLAIVRGTVQAHGGTVRLADAEPGLRVEVSLPLSEAVRRPDP